MSTGIEFTKTITASEQVLKMTRVIIDLQSQHIVYCKIAEDGSNVERPMTKTFFDAIVNALNDDMASLPMKAGTLKKPVFVVPE